MSAGINPSIVQIIYIALAWILYPLHFSVSSYIKYLNIPHHTVVYAASFHADPDSL
jgi:hypothetical protein